MNVNLSKDQTLRISLPSRIQAIDFVRGLVMILMALDHASSYWNQGRFFGEFWNWGRPPLPDLLQFLVRFVSHWCAPTFVFLAGTSIVLFETNRINKGVQDNEITKHLAIRGLV
ncbi:MAG: heparan-alpha-glucosaminide N-acetyltransferase domain-containing protein, partial [Candidatus Hodarchaeota archaeon]